MGEIRRLRRNVLRCNFCLAESPLRKATIRTEYLFLSLFEWDQDTGDQLMERYEDHTKTSSTETSSTVRLSLYRGGYGWWCLEIEKSVLKRGNKNRSSHKQKLFYCPECTDRMVDVKRIEKIVDGLFDGGKVLQFKKDVLPAHEAAL